MRNIALILASLFVVGSAFAAESWNIDETHSAIHFKVRHMVVATVTGDITGMKGKADYDGDKLVGAETTADVSTINTGVAKRDGHLKSPDFFDATKFPTLSFKSKKVEGSDGKYKMTGDLTMHGVTKEVTLDVDAPSQTVKGMDGSPVRGFTATGKVNRKDFGLKWNKVIEGGGVAVGEDVDVTIDCEVHGAKKSDKKG